MVFGLWSVSCPPLATPPLSCTWKVKLAKPAPLALAAGVYTKLAMLAKLMLWPAVTGTPLRVKLPLAGKVVMLTAWKLLAGLSFGSVKPKSAALKLRAVSSKVVSVALVPAGASLTAVTLKVMVFGVVSYVPKLSCTLNVKLARGAP